MSLIEMGDERWVDLANVEVVEEPFPNPDGIPPENELSYFGVPGFVLLKRAEDGQSVLVNSRLTREVANDRGTVITMASGAQVRVAHAAPHVAHALNRAGLNARYAAA